MKQSEFLAVIDKEAVVAAIARAEKRCSGEIRVHVQPKAFGRPVREAAERTFERLRMTATAHRNGVLLFIASEEQTFSIIGDKGIDERVPPDFWNDVAARLGGRFKSGELTAGIVEAIDAIGEHLARYFPRTDGDPDELSNEISISDRDE